MSKPLEGIKVIEVGQEIQGPFAGLVLADMGAERYQDREPRDRGPEPLADLRIDRRTRGQKPGRLVLLHRDEPR